MSKHTDPMSNFLQSLQHHTWKTDTAEKGSFFFLSVTPGDFSCLKGQPGIGQIYICHSSGIEWKSELSPSAGSVS